MLAGLAKLGKLTDWIQMRGYRWFSAVPGVGEVAAARVVDWLLRNKKDLAIALDLRARFPRRELVESWQATMRAETRIAPLERLAVPAQLDGSQGTNRLQGVARTDARNDRQAIEAWVAARAGDNAATARTYRREAERLLLWAIFERNRQLSSLNVDDAIAYRSFLRDPQPAARWVKARRETAVRLSPEWRPFHGPLPARSAAYAITVLGSLFDWLVRQHYLAHNPLGALPRERTVTAEASPDVLPAEHSRYLTTGQWAVLRAVLPSLGSDEEGLRARLLVLLGYTTGQLRAAQARVAEGADDESEGQPERPVRRASLLVLGKGGRVREVPIVTAVEQLIDQSLESRGLPTWVECQRQSLNGVRLIGHLSRPEPSPEILQKKHGEDWEAKAEEAQARREAKATRQGPRPTWPLTSRSIYRLVREAFEVGEAWLRKKGMDADANVFAKPSTHWLRHTFGRHMLAGDVKLNVVQAVLGHQSVVTTTIYSSDDGDGAWDAVQKVAKKRV